MKNHQTTITSSLPLFDPISSFFLNFALFSLLRLDRLTVMARPFSMIVDINDKKQTWKLAVRITRVWYVEIPKKPMAIEMLLTDAKGDRIHAVVKGNDAIPWKPILKEDSCYTMQNFDVKPNDGQYKTCLHPFKLLFMSGTTVKENDLLEVPHDVFHFTPFDEILSGKACTNVLVDVIGVFDKMGRYHPDAKLKKVEFSLKGQSGTTLNCTLWEGYASKLVSFIDNHNGGPIVIILTFAKIKEPQGIFPLSIQNSKFCSRLLINADVPEIQKYKESLDPSQTYESGTIIMSQVSGSSQLSSQDNFFYKADVKTLSEICSLMKECQCVTVATIDMILTRHGWNYDGCTSCSRGEDSCKCVNPKIVPRFKVEIKVCYKGEYANFIMWNNECFELLNETALELKNKMIAAGEYDPYEIPEPIDNIVGKTLAFKIKVQPTYNRSSVVRVSPDKNLIDMILQKFTAEKACSHDKGKSVSSIVKEDDQCEIQSLSATADYDPDLLEAVTPAKRVLSNTQFEEIPTQDLASTQLSSTKLSKHIKME